MNAIQKTSLALIILWFGITLTAILVTAVEVRDYLKDIRIIESEQRDDQNVLNCWFLNKGEEVKFYQCLYDDVNYQPPVK